MDAYLWHRKASVGFTTIPRIIGCLSPVFKELKIKGDPSSVYFDLWCRAFDEQYVIVRSEDDLAFTAGYSGQRAKRTWKEHIRELARMKFILTQGKGNTEFGYILILNPYAVLANLYLSKKIEEFTWNALRERCLEVGSLGELDDALALVKPKKGDSEFNDL
ncbi:hypothetical protein H5P28_15375 [Ruficoccus amylovorans]|uniref:Uncharacterized protein n=1 Tax=Ruficoccus amylovorans TaxID=1804625 RepID=A0A842HI24_9BACT|nr:hypothetical protein [Ruficoccus amylovorans]MBC2595648.1 hypothetical protein [Ruficoccus amylovorans]